MDSSYSIVQYLAQSDAKQCGYCKSCDTNFTIGMWTQTMTAEDYQNLIDRGWRRCGLYCYKPSLTITCCPQYTIRCDALNLKLSKSQKKLLKRISKFLKEGLKSGNVDNKGDDSDESTDAYTAEPAESSIFDKRVNEIMEENSSKGVPAIIEIEAGTEQVATENRFSEPSNQTNTSMVSERANIESLSSSEKRPLKTPRPGIGQDSSKPQCKKAKVFRLEKKRKKLEEKGISPDMIKKNEKSKEKTLEDFLQESICDNPVNKLELKLVRSHPRSREFDQTFDLEFALYQKYESIIHRKLTTNVNEYQFTRFLITSPLKIRLVPSKCEKRLLRESWKLFVKYQTTVHKESLDECDYSTFHRFLVASPLQSPSDNQRKNSFKGYGSYHQQYWLNGKLIAVGVIDILPRCVSSVYFFYDPDYSFLSLGTYGSLRELELTRSLHRNIPDIKNYYMGFYIHSCPKMRYKARYHPSYLLCPKLFTWHPIAECQLKLDNDKYCKFNDDQDAVCDDNFININRVLVLWNQIAMPYSSYKIRAKNIDIHEDEEVLQYAELVGRKCAEKMLLYRTNL